MHHRGRGDGEVNRYEQREYGKQHRAETKPREHRQSRGQSGHYGDDYVFHACPSWFARPYQRPANWFYGSRLARLPYLPAVNIDLGLWDFLIFAVAGVGTGIVNTLAGSGSLVTLPIFIFICGLPAPVANGTNRIGVAIQSLVAARSFHKSGTTPLEGSAWIIAPALIGAVVGSRIAVDISETAMNYTIGGLMVFMLIVLTVNPKRWIQEHAAELHRNRRPLSIAVYFLIGVYGGFIQAGVGIFLLAGLVLMSRYALGPANGIKLLVVAAYSIPVLIVFFLQDQVHLGYGLLMAVFQATGAWIAVRFVVHVPNADVWIHRLLIVVVAASALKFFL